MNWNQVEGNWEQFKGEIRTRWGRLTDDDLEMIAGNQEKLAGKIQQRYGKVQDEVYRDIETWLSMH